MRHHDIIAANAAGTSVVLTEHSNSERGYLPRLARRMRDLLPELAIRISTEDADPLSIV
jgi:putative NIF3 family GTP cyclohydrolase 1 type 2